MTPRSPPTASSTRPRRCCAATARRRPRSSTWRARSASATAASTGTFRARQALRDAVTRALAAPGRRAAAGDRAEERGPAPARLRRWFDALIAIKRRKLLDEPELFATYHALAEDAREVVRAHVAELVGQVARIIARRRGARAPSHRRSRGAPARAVFDATARFHHPVHARGVERPGHRRGLRGGVAPVDGRLDGARRPMRARVAHIALCCPTRAPTVSVTRRIVAALRDRAFLRDPNERAPCLRADDLPDPHGS